MQWVFFNEYVDNMKVSVERVEGEGGSKEEGSVGREGVMEERKKG